jgi:hypothetical protein
MTFKNKNSYNSGEEKCQVILHFLGTPHYQALGQGVNSNVEHIFRTFNICNSQEIDPHFVKIVLEWER